MIPYLLNVSAIWALSLAVYLLALRKEVFHSYNRLFLLLTLAMGLVLPLLPVPGSAVIYAAPVQAPVAEVVQELPLPADPVVPQHSVAIPWLALLYLAGAGFMLALLLRDGIQLIRLYRKGRKYRMGDWLVIETGREHSPFSFRHLLFVGNRSGYTDGQWEMILGHERQHARLGHSADLMLIQLLRVVFWFHPLVHLYHRLLLLVHEYEADARVQAPAASYGRFLIEQALLQGAPSLAHSFNRSPIKNRIHMLSRSVSRPRYARLLLALPLTLVSVCCFMKLSYAQQGEWQGNVFSYRGNKIEMKINEPLIKQGQIRMNVGSGADKSAPHMKVEPFSITILPDTTPARLNGRQIYRGAEIATVPKFRNANEPVGVYLFNRVKPLLDELPDGKGWQLDIRDLVVNEQGKVVFFEYHGLRNTFRPGEPEPTGKATPEQRLRLQEKVSGILYDEVTFTPATNGGQPVPYLLEDLRPYRFTVSNGSAAMIR